MPDEDPAMPPQVRVRNGALSGSWESDVAVFRGIPYSAPPVGAHRFGAPRRADDWDGVRPAVAFGPPVPQSDAFGRGAPPATSDDWLTVNVWSPAPDPAARLPVLVWIYGGGYTVGMASWPEYDGGHLARDGNLVLVTFNYRLGLEGFGALAGAPANRGLLDQVAALEWVRDNVTAFGGDPDRVTIFGESAGGGSVAALLAMPRAAGLFHGAIAQSVPGAYFTPELASAIATACAAEIGLEPTVTDLAEVDPGLLARTADAVTAGPAAYESMLFAPVVDGDVLPATPWQALAAGAAHDVVLLAGHTRHEQRLFSLINGELGRVTPEQAAHALDTLAPAPDGAQRYRDAFPDAAAEELYELVHSDWLFRMPTVHLADAHTGRTYLYELTWPAPGMGGILGACHGLDVPLVFGNLTAGGPAALLGDEPGPDAADLSARMRAAWTRFATAGDPGWPAYDPGSQLTQIFDVPGDVAPYPEQHSRQIWQHHVFAPLGQ
ncbi:carboxylesterase family protein [Winogradskya consettensis]